MVFGDRRKISKKSRHTQERKKLYRGADNKVFNFIWSNRMLISNLKKTIVVKIKGQWQLLQVEDGEIFTDNLKAIKYFDDVIEADSNNDN